MDTAPRSNRKHIVIFGDTNAGKSALFNIILNTNTAIVSHVAGTTTDPVSKAFELFGFGAAVLVDTAGLNDCSEIGKQRVQKTKEMLASADLVLHVVDVNNSDNNEIVRNISQYSAKKVPYILVASKSDLKKSDEIIAFEQKYNNSIAVSINDPKSIDRLKKYMAEILTKTVQESSLIEGLLSHGDVAVMVVPIDSGAPQGRLILPQVQFIRACLDSGVRCNVTTPENLNAALQEKVNMVVTDSQVFKQVADNVSESISLTSFSILSAWQKGGLDKFVKSVGMIKNLKNGDKVLIAEACTHTSSHQDIGRVKIPNALSKLTSAKLDISFSQGRQYPDNMADFSLIIHCGGCMLTPTEMQNRISGLPVTNYGIVLAHAEGILKRSLMCFEPEVDLSGL